MIMFGVVRFGFGFGLGFGLGLGWAAFWVHCAVGKMVKGRIIHGCRITSALL